MSDRLSPDVKVPGRTFRLGAYLADRWWVVVIGVIALGSVLLVGSVLGLSGAGLFLLGTVIVGCWCGVLAIGFLRRQRFYRDLEALATSADTLAEAVALLERPAFLEGRITTTALEDLSLRASAQEAALEQEFSDYRTYIEAWVHEVRTPLAAAQLIAARLDGTESASLAAELERIERQVQTVLYYARTRTLTQDYVLRELSLTQVVREACRKNARLLIEQGCTPSVAIDETVTVIADRSWLLFMLSQIIVNAAKYGATTVTFSVVERTESTSAGHTTLEIADNGWGISESDAPRVFDRGFTGDNGRSQGQATGMGLYLVATMAATMGVHVGLASEVGVGTRVLLTFPHAF